MYLEKLFILRLLFHMIYVLLKLHKRIVDNLIIYRYFNEDIQDVLI